MSQQKGDRRRVSRVTTTRRGFLGGVAAGASLIASPERVKATNIDPDSPVDRVQKAYNLKVRRAEYFRDMPLVPHPSTSEESVYPDFVNSFSKTLPHDALGMVDKDAYASMLKALRTGVSADFEAIKMGGTVKLVSPQAAYSHCLEGCDSSQLTIRPAPAFNSAEQAGEMVELYWMALTRDVHFSNYDTDPKIQQAVADLNKLSDFRGPKINGQVTPRTIFRGTTPGELVGPYLSQFALLPTFVGALPVAQYRVPVAGVDYLTDYNEWLRVQNGFPGSADRFDPVRRYLRNGRDLGEFIHRDFSYQIFLTAAQILLGFGRLALGEDNPYVYSTSQGGFVTFGSADVFDALARVAKPALQAVWYQKWLVHRRARPEEFGGRVHNHLTNKATYDIHADLQNSAALPAALSASGSYLLSHSYPEGAPVHPAYPSGHAIIAGACATVLKAFFRNSFVIPNPVVPSADGLSLLPYTGPPLTVEGELNKLASNDGLGRDWAGIHWRTDIIEGMKQGEEVAIHVMRDLFSTYTEEWGGCTFNRFDGTPYTVCARC